jgi:hypothetical protein
LEVRHPAQDGNALRKMLVQSLRLLCFLAQFRYKASVLNGYDRLIGECSQRLDLAFTE